MQMTRKMNDTQFDLKTNFEMAEGTLGCARGISEDIMTYCQINILENTIARCNRPYIEIIRKTPMDFFGGKDFTSNLPKND